MVKKAQRLHDFDPHQSEVLAKQAERLINDVGKCQTAFGIRGIKEIARSDPAFAREATKLDALPDLINLQNGTLNLRSGEFKPHTPADLITKVCNANIDVGLLDVFDPEIHCPKWSKFLGEVLPAEGVRDFVQVLMGLALLGEQIEHVLVVFFGNGRNGKGVFYEVMRFVLGDYAIEAPRDLFTSGPNAHTTGQTDLMGSRLAFVNETDEDARLSEGLVKDATGGGVHTARKMKQDFIRFKRTWLPVMITNYFPKVSGKGVAIWDRMKVVEFPVYFDENSKDTGLVDELKKEADGIFLWAYAGWAQYLRTGKLVVPPEVVAATQRQRHENDKVQQWIDERCARGWGREFQCKPKILLEAYNVWADTTRGDEVVLSSARRMGLHEFNKVLRAKDFRYIDNKALFEGLRVLTDAELDERRDGRKAP